MNALVFLIVFPSLNRRGRGARLPKIRKYGAISRSRKAHCSNKQQIQGRRDLISCPSNPESEGGKEVAKKPSFFTRLPPPLRACVSPISHRLYLLFLTSPLLISFVRSPSSLRISKSLSSFFQHFLRDPGSGPRFLAPAPVPFPLPISHVLGKVSCDHALTPAISAFFTDH